MITRLKFETYFEINKIKSRRPGDQELIKLAREEYDCNITEKDIKEMRENYESLMYRYIN